MDEFFTRNGDNGQTGFLGKGRISKAHPRIEALGTIDETSAALGMARCSGIDVDIQEIILNVQHDLYIIMAEVAAAAENKTKFGNLDETRVEWLEEQTNLFSTQVKIPNKFILPGDSPSSAAIAFARTVIRRAERRLIELQNSGEENNPLLIKYLNRLSSLFFILELVESERKR